MHYGKTILSNETQLAFAAVESSPDVRDYLDALAAREEYRKWVRLTNLCLGRKIAALRASALTKYDKECARWDWISQQRRRAHEKWLDSRLFWKTYQKK